MTDALKRATTLIQHVEKTEGFSRAEAITHLLYQMADKSLFDIFQPMEIEALKTRQSTDAIYVEHKNKPSSRHEKLDLFASLLLQELNFMCSHFRHDSRIPKEH